MIRSRKPFWALSVLALFSCYGPSVSFAGQLRYVELAVLAIGILNVHRILRSLGVWERRLVYLLLLSALAHVVSDQINGAELNGTVKRAGTYFLLAVLFPVVKWLGGDNWLRIRWILLGYCVSHVVILLFGQSFSSNYGVMPWRLGLGYAATILVCLAIAWRPNLLLPGAIALAALASIHLFLGSRSLAAIVIVVAGLAWISAFRKTKRPISISFEKLVAVSISSLALLVGIYKAAEYGTEQNWYPPELQTKMEEQFSNPYGLIAAARPDSAAAIYAISLRPITGHGSTNVHPDVFVFYKTVAFSSYLNSSSYDDLFTNSLNQEWTLGTPSHSHLLGAWADAGLLAMVSWLFTLILAGYCAIRAGLWRSRYAPLVTFLALMTIWDILFSPGPHRMDVAIRLTVLFFGISQFRLSDGGQISTRQRETRRMRYDPKTALSSPRSIRKDKF